MLGDYTSEQTHKLVKALLLGQDTGDCPPFAIINPDDKRVVLNEKGERCL